MIQSGGWSNLRTLDEHVKLARVAVSFDPRLDEAFKINVAKMRVQLPQQLRDQIEKAIGPVIKIAQTTYRRSEGGGRSSLGSSASPRGDSTNNPPREPSRTPSAQHESHGRPGNGGLWTVNDLRREAERVATAVERPVIRTVFDRLSNELMHG